MTLGLYLSAAGALASFFRQDVHANNLANVNTTGFKPDLVHLRERLPAGAEHPRAMSDARAMLERLGGGTLLDPTRIDFTQGKLVQTGGELDLAITGQGFFVIHAGRGEDPIRFTRDGQFTLNTAGDLVMAAMGMRVLDVNDQPVRLDSSIPASMSSRGEILQNGRVVAQLQIAAPTDPSLLIKAGDNLLRFAPGAAAGRVPADGTLSQGYLEGSGVDPILAMNAMISASKAAQSNAALMQYHDHIMGEAINTFGRVA
jgi:flagellar basal-body rod protein FlgF